MKNFKLLLATATILSTGAIVANAENPSVTMKVGVNINRAGVFEKIQDLNFGSVIIPDNAKTLNIYMDDSGIVTADDESVHVLGDAFMGITEGAPCALLVYPEDEVLLNTYPAALSNGTAYVSGIQCTDTMEGTASNEAMFFAESLHISSDAPLQNGSYTGSFTITAVYPN